MASNAAAPLGARGPAVSRAGAVPQERPRQPGALSLGVGLLNDPLRLSLFLLTLLTVSRIHQHFGVLAKVRPALLLFFVALAIAFLRRRSISLSNLFDTWPPKVIAGLAVAACASAAFGISLGASASYIISDYSKVLVYAVLLIVAVRSVKDIWLFVVAYVAGSAILVWMSMFVFRLSVGYGSHTARLSNLYTFDANDLGLVLLVGLPLTLILLHISRGVWKLACMGVVMGIGVALARSGSRGAMVGLAVVAVAILVSLKQVAASKRLAFVGVLLAGLVVAAPPGYWQQMGTLLSLKQDYNMTSPDGRKEVAKRGLQYMASRPLFGIGINNFGRAEGTIGIGQIQELQRNYRKGVKWSAAHNSYVQVGAELGIFGLVLYMTLLVGCIASLMKLRRRIPPVWARAGPEEQFLY
ncbi:MAG: O-antigen ligase family protein, partial [Gemmatimonadaceae bacterium]